MLVLSRGRIQNAHRLVNRLQLLETLPSTSKVVIYRFYAFIRRAAALPNLPDKDAKLINIGDFSGIKGSVKRPEKDSSPEVELSIIEQHLRQNFRVSAEAIFCNIVKPLEEGNEQLLSTLHNNHERWLPTLFLSCGRAMSNVHKTNRVVILERIINQLKIHQIPWSTSAFNSYLRVLMENDVEFDVNKELQNAEVTKGLTLDQESFRLFLEQLSLQGSVDASRNLTYEMAKRGFILDAQCNASIIYGFGVLGYSKKADSLYEQTTKRNGPEGQKLSLEALTKAAAARSDIERLRTVLRLAVDEDKKLILGNQCIFDIIWLLTERSRTRDGLEIMTLIEQILERTNHQWGFFKLLIREIERHIAHEHYYMALTLLEDSTKVRDFIQKQHKLVLVDQIQTRICRQLVRTHSPISKVKEVANRVMVVLKGYPSISKYIYHELLKNVLTFKEFSLDTRFEYFSSLIDFVDLDRTRPHLILPLIASCDDPEARLPILFRCESLGYKDFSQLDTKCLASLVLQPLYDKQRAKTTHRGVVYTKVGWMSRILKSYGFSDTAFWYALHEWWKIKKSEGESPEVNDKNGPNPEELSKWLRENYDRIFTVAEKPRPKNIEPTYYMLKNLIISGDAANVHSFITFYGWPTDTMFEDIVPKILDLYLEQLDWPSIQIMLKNLSLQQDKWAREDGKVVSPIKNYHLLRLLRERLVSIIDKNYQARKARELQTEELSKKGDEEKELKQIDDIRHLIAYAYELRQLFPYASSQYETFFETLHEYNQLFSRCFRLNSLTLERVEDCLELLRTLIKLEFIHLHANETISATIVENVLTRFGWMAAVNTWMTLQSGFYASNGIVPLLINASRGIERDPQRASDLQYVLHKAQNFLPASRVHSLYAAILISLRKYDEAVEYVVNHRAEIDSLNIVAAFRLINNLRSSKKLNDEFVYKFAEIMLENSRLKEDQEQCQELQKDFIRLCETKKLGRFALQLFDLFHKTGIQMDTEQQDRIMKIAKQHAELERRWIFKPNGFLSVSQNDEIVSNSDFWIKFNQYSDKIATPPS